VKKIMKKNRDKEYDTQTLSTGFEGLSKMEQQAAEDAITKIYEPRPLTPDDDIYDNIIEQFASSPTKPKYWFEEFGDYWSCSCGHINKGAICKSCGLERELLRSLFILHKPADAPGELNKKLKKAKAQVDQEEEQQAERDRRRMEREASGEDMMVVPIERADKPVPETDAEPEAEHQTEAVPEITPEISEHEDHGTETEEEKAPENVPTAQNTPEKSSDSVLHEPAALIVKPPAELKIAEPKTTEIKVAETITGKPKKNRFRLKIIISIIICFILVVAGGITIYFKMAAPAMQYEEAQQLQEAGKYQKAIEKYEALGDYKDAKALIWECWIGIGDRQYDEGLYEEAIETFGYVLENTENEDMNDRIRQCHIAIGDKYMEAEEYTDAISSYTTALEMKGSEEIQDKINDAKFAYVKKYKDDRTEQVEKFMNELRGLSYEGIQEIYDEYYAWKIKIVTNTVEDDYSTDVETVSRKDTVYFHTLLSGGEPDETIQVYYEIIWPNGHSEIYNIDSSWEDGSKITARFQYSMPVFGKEGTLTFKLYDISTHELLASDSVTFKN